jgi:Carboxypeptidase regulatory-like domain
MGSTALRGAVGSAVLVCALVGQALAAGGTIKGKVMVPSTDFDPSSGFVVAVSDKLDIFRVAIDADGSYMIDNVVPGKYTVSAIRGGLTAPDATGVDVKDGQTVEQNFAMTVPKPYCVLKSASAIPLGKDIDSDAFADADEIHVGDAKTVGVSDNGDLSEWGKLGGPKLVSGRFRIKYSDQAIHLAADVTFQMPLVNPNMDDHLWQGNALEFDIQDDPYDVTRSDKNKSHNWQVVVGLGSTADWWEHNVYNMRPRINGQTEQIDSHIKRTPRKDGEKFRLDIPWGILLTEDENGKAISPPKDNAVGAMDLVLDVANPADPTQRRFQVEWSGLGNSHWNASSLNPVQFCPKKP